MKLFKTLFLTISVCFTVGCGTTKKPVTSITLNESSFSLDVGQTKQLIATVQPSDATDKTVTWSVTGESVSVDQKGLVTALKVGDSTVNCVSNSDQSIKAQCSFSVREPGPIPDVKVTSIEFSKSSISLNINEEESIVTTIKPDNATNKELNWTTSNNKVATVSNGKVTATGVGEAIVTATAKDGSGVFANCSINVSDILVTSIKILKNNIEIKSLSIDVGQKATLTTSIQPTNASDKSIKWSSDKPLIASVNDGVVNPIAKGTCQIKALNEHSGVYATIDVTVNEPTVPTYLPSNYYGDYYDDNFSWSSTSDLKTKLFNLMQSKRTEILNYGKSPTNWSTNTEADRTEYDFEYLDVVYSENDILASKTNTDWQREHAFAASLMTGLSTGNAVDSDNYKDRANDFQNLFAAYSSANSSRGNKNLGTATGTSIKYIGDCKYDTKNFEPNNKDKGRLARALIYMATMNGQVSFEPLSLKEEYVEYVSGKNPQAHGNLSTLVNWALTYPVDRLEQQHNISVATSNVSGRTQGNRNVFTDYPQLVEYIYGSKKDVAGELKHLTPSVYTLDMYSSGEYYNFAIKTAKRTFEVGDTVSLSADLNLVNVKKDNSYAADTNFNHFTINGISNGYTFTASDIGTKTITISKSGTNPYNYSKSNTQIQYTIEVVSKDPIPTCSYQHVLTSGSAKSGEFYNISTQCNVVHEMKMDGLTWNVFWKESKVGQNKATLGTQFGLADTSAKTIYFETKSDFSMGGRTNFNMIYFSGASSASKSADIKIYVNGVTKYASTLAPGAEKSTYGITFDQPLSGKIKIELTNITGAAYIHTIAINAIS